MKGLLAATAVLLCCAHSAAAGEELDRPLFWPTVRYSWPEKLSVGGALQPQLGGALDRLILSGTIGRGGYKVGVGLGAFGGNLMAGTAVSATVTRTTAHPLGAAPNQTFVGVEPQIMAANISIKGGPAFRIAGQAPSKNRLRFNVSVGYGF